MRIINMPTWIAMLQAWLSCCWLLNSCSTNLWRHWNSLSTNLAHHWWSWCICGSWCTLVKQNTHWDYDVLFKKLNQCTFPQFTLTTHITTDSRNFAKICTLCLVNRKHFSFSFHLTDPFLSTHLWMWVGLLITLQVCQAISIRLQNRKDYRGVN